MKRQKILAVLTLLMGLTGIQVTQASSVVNNKLKENTIYELNDIVEKKKSNGGSVDSMNYLSKILDETIQTKVFSYLRKEISLTSFKKELNNNIQKRRKIHKNLVYEYNKDLQSEKYFELIENNGLKIDKLSKLKNIFFDKVPI